MTPREKLKETLEKNQKEYEQLPDWAKNLFFPKDLFRKIEKVEPIQPVEWQFANSIYL